MNQLLGQQDTPGLRDRDGGRTEMLSKQAAELSLSDAQAFGQAIDTRFVECACVDQRQRRDTVFDVPRQAASSGAVSGRHRRQGRKPASCAAAAVA